MLAQERAERRWIDAAKELAQCDLHDRALADIASQCDAVELVANFAGEIDRNALSVLGATDSR